MTLSSSCSSVFPIEWECIRGEGIKAPTGSIIEAAIHEWNFPSSVLPEVNYPLHGPFPAANLKTLELSFHEQDTWTKMKHYLKRSRTKSSSFRVRLFIWGALLGSIMLQLISKSGEFHVLMGNIKRFGAASIRSSMVLVEGHEIHWHRCEIPCSSPCWQRTGGVKPIFLGFLWFCQLHSTAYWVASK